MAEKKTGKLRTFLVGSFRRRLTFSFIAIAVVPLVLCGFLMIEAFRRSVENTSRQDAETLLGTESSLMEEMLGKIDDSMEMLSLSPAVRDALGAGNAGVQSVTMHLYSATTDIRGTARFDLLSPDGICLYTTGARQDGESLPSSTGVLRMAREKPGETALLAFKPFSSTTTSRASTRLRAARVILDQEGNPAGYITASVTKDSLDTLLAAPLSSRDGVAIVNRWYEEVYSTQTAYQADAAAFLRQAMLTDGETEQIFDGFEIYIRPISDTGLWQILMKRQVLDPATEASMRTLVWLFALISLAICIFAAVRISKSLTSPITAMTDAMEEVKKGNLSVRIPEGRPDELGALSENFNRMTERIDRNMKERVENEKKLNDVRIAMMQAQLNPHFLYNTLDSIKWLAKAGGVPEIATLSSKLAKILRTAISGAPFIPLSEEFRLCENYAEIQNIRFGGKYAFSFQLPENLRDCQVPKLVLQPIVENACIHGLEEREEGSILVAARDQNETLVLTVEDDGIGMDDAMLDRINRHDWNGIQGHIGLSNVDSIVRLNYGKEYGLRAERRDRGGTVIIIEMPKKMEHTGGGNDHVGPESA